VQWLSNWNKHDWGWWIALCLPLIGILPSVSTGIMDAADAPLHVQRIHAMSVMLAQGELYPRWITWFHLGFGYPIFNFYPPAVFWLGGCLVNLGFTPITAFHAVAAVAWMLGSVGMYGLAREFIPPSGALVAAALWSYAPSRLYEVWFQGSLPQAFAAAWIPLLFYGMVRAARVPSRRSSALVAIALFGLVMSHQPMTFITALFAAPVSLLLIVAESRHAGGFWRRALAVYGGLTLGAALSAIFLLPLFLELRYVAAVSGTDDVIPYLQSNFLRWRQVFDVVFPLDRTDLRQDFPTTLGLWGGILFALGIAVFAWQRRWGILLGLTVALCFSVFMLLAPSLPLWIALPYFDQLRFPARFLRISVVWLALGGGASILWIPSRWRGGVSFGLITACIAVSLPLVVPSQSFLHSNEFSARAEVQFESENITLGTTSYNEFNPIWGETIPISPPPDLDRYAESATQLNIYQERYPHEWLNENTLRVTLDAPQTVMIRQFYYPGWVATLNGEPANIYPEAQEGMIALDLPAGEHTMTYRYVGTWSQRLGTAITLVALGIVALLSVWGAKPSAPQANVIGWRIGLTTVIGIMTFALLNRFVIQPYTGWFRTASPADAPRYMGKALRAPFGDAMELLGYTLYDTGINHSTPLDVVLYWHPLRDLAGEGYYPVVQLVPLQITEAWAVSQPYFPGGGHTDFPENGYTPARFTSDPHTLRLFDHITGEREGQIMVQLFSSATGRPLTLPDGSDRILLPERIRVR
jgi:hypothetical protein